MAANLTIGIPTRNRAGLLRQALHYATQRPCEYTGDGHACRAEIERCLGLRVLRGRGARFLAESLITSFPRLSQLLHQVRRETGWIALRPLVSQDTVAHRVVVCSVDDTGFAET